jgi:predicted 3-demethylubiquinone-9 3-methyltransferase (glyoxalase superfamily)
MKARKSPVRGAPKVAVNGITPFLWYVREAEEAATFYVSLFRNSRILDVNRPGGSGGRSQGPAQSVVFRIAGRELIALNGGPMFRFTPAISLFVSCTGQAQVDALRGKLTRGGKASQCGWLTDRFGLSWQIIPSRLIELLNDPDSNRAGRALAAMMKMQKIDVATLERAADGA